MAKIRLEQPTETTNTAPKREHIPVNERSGGISKSLGKWLDRRSLLAVLGIGAASSALATSKPTTDAANNRKVSAQQNVLLTTAAKQQIAELRCQYARATDLIGTNQPAAVAEGRAIYRQIFTPNAVIGATGREDVQGPDAWVDVVLDALKVYAKTQHLIGTQLVSVQKLPAGPTGHGQATMSSYLQAWHAKADGELWLFIGTYADRLVHSADKGWQIAQMRLEQVSGETRQLNS